MLNTYRYSAKYINSNLTLKVQGLDSQEGILLCLTTALPFSSGVATWNISNFIPKGYVLDNALSQLSEASTIVINSTKVSTDGTITIRAYKLSDGSAYTGSGAGVIRVFAFCKKTT